jgi:hypothetical protein
LVLWFLPISQTYVSAIHIPRIVHLFQQKAIIAAEHLPPAQQLRQLGEVRRHAAGLVAVSRRVAERRPGSQSRLGERAF